MNKPIVSNLSIIGAGLIGSSIACAARLYGAAKSITIFDSNPDVRGEVRALEICDAVAPDLESAVSSADIIMLAAPPAVLAGLARLIAPHMKQGAILTDAGSVKVPVSEAASKALLPGRYFIGGHPISGTEQSGPRAGFATLFDGRWCILTAEDPASAEAHIVKDFWERLGSTTEFMDAKRHDLVLATTSHLPHIVAFALVGTALDMESLSQNEVIKYSAGGFRDFTRLAASSPVMWRDVFLQNKSGVLEVLDRYIEDLTALKRAIRWDDGEALLAAFSRTGDVRRRIIEAGQELDAINFGRRSPSGKGPGEPSAPSQAGK